MITFDNFLKIYKMKNINKLVFVLLLINHSLDLSSQWTTGAGYVYWSPTTDNVGIGIGFPTADLEVGGDAKINGITVGRGNESPLYNTAFGYEALKVNDVTGILNEGYSNSAFGYLSLTSTTTGYYNSAFGQDAVRTNTTGFSNSGFGSGTLQYNATGYQNSAFGSSSALFNSTGSNNTAIGHYSMFSNVAGSNATAVGAFSMWYSNNTATGFTNRNVAVGFESLRGSVTAANNTGNFNTAIGYQSLINYTSGEGNSGLGYQALFNNSTGNKNVGIGVGALSNNTTGEKNTSLGYGSDVTGSSFTNATAVGYNATVNASNKVRIGNTNVTVIEGQVAWSWPSDARFKSNIREDVPGLDFINKLRPVTYTFESEKFDDFLHKGDEEYFKNKNQEDYKLGEAKKHSGLIAQEVETVIQEIGYDFDGLNVPSNENDNYSISYSSFTIPLIVSVQELSEQDNNLLELIALQNSQIENLNNQVTALTAIVQEFTGSRVDPTTINSTTSSQKSWINQNVPNPFSGNTTITYFIASNAKNSKLIITNELGIIINSISLEDKQGSIILDSKLLTSGKYTYSLIVDDVVIDTKSFIISR